MKTAPPTQKGRKPAPRARKVAAWVESVLFVLLFHRRLRALLAQFESLFAAWQSGTLPPPPAPRPQPARHVPTSPAPSERPKRARAPARHTPERHPRTPQAAPRPRPARAIPQPAPRPLSARARSPAASCLLQATPIPMPQKFRLTGPRGITPISLRFHNK